MGIKIEQFIYTNVNRRGREIEYATFDEATTKTDFEKIIEYFILPNPLVNIIFSKFNSKYFLYSQCQEYGHERIGKKKTKGRKGNVYISLLLPLNMVKELNYDFSLIHFLLYDYIDWKNIINIVEEKNKKIEPFYIEFKKRELEKKLINYIIKERKKIDLSFVKKEILSDSKTISNSNILNLIACSSILPKIISEDKIISNLSVYKISDEILYEKKSPYELYDKQIDFILNPDRRKYRVIKESSIFTIKSVNKGRNSSGKTKEKTIIENKSKKIKYIFLIFVVILIFFIFHPFYKYYKLTKTYKEDINFKTIKTYNNLKNKNILLKYLTNIDGNYKKNRSYLYVKYKRKIIELDECDNKYLPFIIESFINEYKGNRDIKEVEQKKIDNKSCILYEGIIKDKENIHDFSELNSIISKIKKYRNLISYSNDDFFKDLVGYYLIYEKLNFKKIKEMIENENNKNILKYIEEYKSNAILFYYSKSLEEMKDILNNNKINIKIKFVSKIKKFAMLKYKDENNKLKIKKIESNTNYSFNMSWNRRSFISLDNNIIYRGRVLSSFDKKINRISFLGIKINSEIKVKIKSMINISPPVKNNIEKNIK